MGAGALSGRFTTVEGIITAVRDQLKQQSSFVMGDSATDEEKLKFEKKLEELNEVLTLKRSIRLVLDDPAGNSYLMVIVFN